VINMSKLGIYFVEGGFSTSREGRYQLVCLSCVMCCNNLKRRFFASRESIHANQETMLAKARPITGKLLLRVTMYDN
jgi:hypothetical protein